MRIELPLMALHRGCAAASGDRPSGSAGQGTSWPSRSRLQLGRRWKLYRQVMRSDVAGMVSRELQHGEVERDVVGLGPVVAGRGVDHRLQGGTWSKSRRGSCGGGWSPTVLRGRSIAPDGTAAAAAEREDPGGLALSVVGHPRRGVLVDQVEKREDAGIGQPVVAVELDDDRASAGAIRNPSRLFDVPPRRSFRHMKRTAWSGVSWSQSVIRRGVSSLEASSM